MSGGVKIGAVGSLILGDGPESGCAVNTTTTVNGGVTSLGYVSIDLADKHRTPPLPPGRSGSAGRLDGTTAETVAERGGC